MVRGPSVSAASFFFLLPQGNYLLKKSFRVFLGYGKGRHNASRFERFRVVCRTIYFVEDKSTKGAFVAIFYLVYPEVCFQVAYDAKICRDAVPQTAHADTLWHS
jgi:hypothetical protein